MKTFPRLFAAAVVALLVLASCKINTINYFPPHPANVRVANVIPDTAVVNVSVAGNPAFYGIAFQTATGYQSFDNTSTTFEVSLPGATSSLNKATYTLTGEQTYTLVTFGAVNAVQTLMIVDTTATSGSGSFALVAVNVATGIGTVDVYLNSPGTDLAGVTPTFPGLTYGGAGVIGKFNSGVYRLRITPTTKKDVIYDSGDRTWNDNTVSDLLIYSKGSAHLPNVALINANSAEQNVIVNNLLAEVKVVNATSDATGAINMLSGGTTVVAGVPYSAYSLYTLVASGANTFTFEATSTPGAALATLANSTGAATDQSFFLFGNPGAVTVVALADMNVPPLSNNMRLRFVNASPDAPPLNVLVNGAQQVTALASPTASSYFELPAGTTAMKFNDSTTGATLLTLADQSLAAGQTYTVYAIGPATALAGLIATDK